MNNLNPHQRHVKGWLIILTTSLCNQGCLQHTPKHPEDKAEQAAFLCTASCGSGMKQQQYCKSLTCVMVIKKIAQKSAKTKIKQTTASISPFLYLFINVLSCFPPRTPVHGSWQTVQMDRQTDSTQHHCSDQHLHRKNNLRCLYICFQKITL